MTTATGQAIRLRPYQDAARHETLAAWEDTQSALIVMPTGTGKTVTLAAILQDRLPAGRALLIAHREELVFQGAQTIRDVTGADVDIEMAEYEARKDLFGRADVVVSTIQTQNAGCSGDGRMTRFDPADFATLIIDEAHHATAESYRRVIDYYAANPNIRILGVTATPDRADEEALGQVFDAVAYDYELPDAIADGWLVPIMRRAIVVEGLDYSSIRTTAGDLNGKDLAAVLEFEEPLHHMAQATVESALAMDPHGLDSIVELPDLEFRRQMDAIAASRPRRRLLVFAASVAHAERLCEILNRWLPGCAASVHGGTPKEDRRQLFRDYSDGRFHVLCNVGVATEGFDEPKIDAVVMARPTKSRCLYAQMAGRGTRPLPGVVDGHPNADARRAAIAASNKPHVEIIDFSGNTGRHKLVTSADILGGKESDRVMDRVAEKTEADAETGQARDVQELIEEAKTEIHKEDEEAARRKHIRVKAKYKTEAIQNAFETFDVSPWRERAWNRDKPPSKKMTALLERAGIDTDGMNYTHAKQLIGEVMKRRDAGKCTYKQAQVLKAHGYSADTSFGEAKELITKINRTAPATAGQKRVLKKFGHPLDVSKSEASQIIDAIAKNGWKRPATTQQQPEGATAQ